MMAVLIAVLLLVTNIWGTSVLSKSDTISTTTTERITMSKEEVMSDKEIEIKKFGESNITSSIMKVVV